MLFLDSAHHHAEMARLNDDSDSDGIDGILNGFCNLLSKPLLHLQAARENIYQSRNLAKPDHLSLGQISNMHFAEEWQHVMLAEAEHFDVFDDDHLVVIDLEEGRAQQLPRIFLISAREKSNGFGHALRRSL